MRICSVCGASASNDKKFCQECGNPLPPLEETTKDTESLSRASNNKNETSKKTMKTSTKIISGVVAILVLAIVVTHFIIQNMLDPYKKLIEANKAFIAEDYKDFASIFSFDKGTIVDPKAFWTYMDEEGWEENITPQIENGLKKIDMGTYAEAIVDAEGNKIITINDKKFLGLYKQYDIQVVPIKVSAYTSIPTATINYANDQQKELTNEKVSLGKFAPGVYKFKLDIVDDVSNTTVTKKKTIAYNEAELFFDFSDATIQLTSDYEDATVFINGKNTKKKATELKIFTLPLDGSVEIYAVYNKDGVNKTSEKVKLTSTDTHISFADVQQKIQEDTAKQDLSDNYGESVKDFYYEYRDEYLNAINNGDFSYISSYYEDGSKLKRDYEKFILDHRKFDYYYNYIFLSNDITNLSVLNSNTFALKSREIFEFHTDTEDNWYYAREKLYTIKVVNDEFIISNIEDIGKMEKTRID